MFKQKNFKITTGKFRSHTTASQQKVCLLALKITFKFVAKLDSLSSVYFLSHDQFGNRLISRILITKDFKIDYNRHIIIDLSLMLIHSWKLIS